MLDSVRGKKVLVTGAGSGIGLAVATRFLDAGAVVAANLLPDDDAGRENLAGISSRGPLHVVAADVADGPAIRAAIDRLIKEIGSIDVLVSNAGIGGKDAFLDLTDEQWMRMFMVNVGGAVNTTRACLPGMLAQNWGRIMYTASELVPLGFGTLTHYVAAKAALVGLARSLAHEVGPGGVTVNCVAPGPTDTPMLRRAADEFNEENKNSIPMRTFGDPDNVAWTWLFLASEAGSWYTGQFVSPNGGVAM